MKHELVRQGAHVFLAFQQKASQTTKKDDEHVRMKKEMQGGGTKCRN